LSDDTYLAQQAEGLVPFRAMLAKVPRKLIIFGGIALLLVGLYAAAGFLLAPRLLRSGMTDFVKEHYGRALRVGEISCNPFSLTVELRDLELPDADGQRLLGFARLYVNASLASVWRRGASLEAIELDRPFLRTVIRRDGSLNLSALSAPFAEKADSQATPADPARLFIGRLQLDEGAVDFVDETRATTFRAQLRPISFELVDFATTGESGNIYALRGASIAGESFSWSGNFGLRPLSSRGNFELSQVQARTLWSYLRDSLGFEVASGVVDVKGAYEFAAPRESVALKVNVRTIGVTDLGIRPPGGAADYVHVARFAVDDTRVDLERRHIDIGKVTWAGGDVRAWRDSDGAINLLGLTKGESAASTRGEATSPWVVSAPDIAIEKLNVALEDRFVRPTASFALNPIDVHITGFNTADRKLNLDAHVAIAETGKLHVNGATGLDAATFKGHADLEQFDLRLLQPYLAAYTQMTLRGGTLTTGLDITRDDQGALTLAGDIDVAQLRTIDNELKQDFVKWDRLRVASLAYQSQPARLKIGSITAQAPYARIVIAPDQTVSVSKVLARPANAPGPVQTVRTESGATNPAGVEKPMPISLGRVRIANGSANFADYWIQPNYAVSLQSLSGTIDGLSSERNSRAKLKLEGKVDRYAPALIAGELNLLSASLFTDIKMNFKGVDMTSITPYSGRFAGYRVEKGKLSVDLTYHVENRTLKADQRFVIDQLELGERVESPEAVHLPLKLAVALLKDRNGVIDIGLPLTGSLDDPQFRVGPLIWKAFLGLLTKAATAPFALLGSLFGGGEQMNLVDFEPGSAVLDAPAQEKLTGLVKAMSERPQLQLDVPASYAVDIDGRALAKTKLDALLAAQAPQGVAALDPAKHFDLLVELHRKQFGKEALLPGVAAETFANRKKAPSFDAGIAALEDALVGAQATTPGELDALATARARAIEELLVAQGSIDAGRVFVIAPGARPPANGKSRVEMSLR